MKEKIRELMKEINLFEIIVAFIEAIIGTCLIKANISISSMLLILAGFHAGKRIIWRKRISNE